MYISKEVFNYLITPVNEDLTKVYNELDNLETYISINGEVSKSVSRMRENMQKHKTILLEARSFLETSVRQQVEVGKTYTHTFISDQKDFAHIPPSVTEYTVIAIKEDRYHIRYSNGEKNYVTFGCPYNLESEEVTDNPKDHRLPEDISE